MKLSGNQHMQMQEDVKNTIIQTQYVEEGDLIINSGNKYRLDDVISKPPVQEEEQIMIRVKRKRDDEPMPELYIDTPLKKTKPTLESITDRVFGIKLDSKPMVQRFSLRSNIKDTSKTMLEFREKSRLDNITHQQELKMIKIGKLREANQDIIEITAEKNVHDVSGDYVYDYYYFDSQIAKDAVPSIMTFDEDLYFDNEYDDDNYFAEDPDTNDEDHPNNEYPDDTDESRESRADDEFYDHSDEYNDESE
jgi:hypothetical protein